jgi:hypothetical protein
MREDHHRFLPRGGDAVLDWGAVVATPSRAVYGLSSACAAALVVASLVWTPWKGVRAERPPSAAIGVGTDFLTAIARAEPTAFGAAGRIRCATYGPTVGCTVISRVAQRSVTLEVVDMTTRRRARFEHIVLPVRLTEKLRSFRPRVFLRLGQLHFVGSFFCTSFVRWTKTTVWSPLSRYPVVSCTSVPSGHTFVVGRDFHLTT